MRKMCTSKIHRATVTEANLDYVGSICIDRMLMERADLLEGEVVEIANLANGARLQTYVIPGPEGSGTICINGAAARHYLRGDLVIILSFLYLDEEAARKHQMKVVHVDRHNAPLA